MHYLNQSSLKLVSKFKKKKKNTVQECKTYSEWSYEKPAPLSPLPFLGMCKQKNAQLLGEVRMRRNKTKMSVSSKVRLRPSNDMRKKQVEIISGWLGIERRPRNRAERSLGCLDGPLLLIVSS